MERPREHLRESSRALQAASHNRALRQLQLALGRPRSSAPGPIAIALVVFAYDHGGASAVGLVALIRWLPAAIASPFTAILGDRYPRVPRDARAPTCCARSGSATMAVCVLTRRADRRRLRAGGYGSP